MLAKQRADYQILIGIPAEAPTEWASASQVTDQHVNVDGHGNIPLTTVRAFVVAYPNGQVVDAELCGLPLPQKMTGLFPGKRIDLEVLQPEDWLEGDHYLRIKYGLSKLKPTDRNHYSTTLTNISKQKVKVLRFAGYTKTRGGFQLNTVTGTFYSAQEFREWYGLGSSDWILPGESAADPNNYGGPPVLWAYYCEAEDGKHFIAGGILE